MAKHRKKQLKKATIAGASVATAVAVAFTPGVSNAISSQTYFIGFPDWLPIGAGSTLPSDPVAINNAIVGAKDTDPLTGWGIVPGGVDLKPAWVTWIDGVPVYTLPVVGQTGTHPQTIPGGSNPAYQPAYDLAYAASLVPKFLGGPGCGDTTCRTNYALNAVKNIPKLFPDTVIQVPDFGITKDGFWTATGDGEWTSPTDLSGLPTIAQLAYGLGAAQNGDLSALAPLLNWTAYLTNVNLIAYGDGAIAAGVAYQAFIDSANGDTQEGYDPYAVGTPQTGPRQIALVDANGNVVKVIGYTQKVTTTVTNNPLTGPNIEYPAQPGDLPDYIATQPGGVIDLTVLSLILIRNPGTPNGGLYARFAPIYQDLTGVNPVTPERQDVLPDGVDPELISKLLAGDASGVSLTDLGDLQAVLESADGKPIVITLKANVGWEYDLMSDAPATANPVAWANSVASSLFLTNMLTGLDFSDLGNGAYVSPDGTFYYTLPVDDLPLLAPLRAPAQVLGLLTGNLDPNTPVADAIEPFLKILVNSAYTDVQRNADGTWTRGLDEFDVPTLFGTQTLTRQQQALMAGDLIAALGKGFGDESNQVLVDAEKQLVAALKLDVTPAQQADIAKALTTPGTTLKNVSREVGDGVSKLLTEVEPNLPKDHVPTQAELAKDQDAVGDVLVDARDDLNKAVASVNKTVGEVQNKNYQGQVALRESLNKVGIKTPAPLTPAQRKAKNEAAVKKATANLQKAGDDIKKVGDDIKKAVNDTVNKVKKAVSGDNS